MDRINEMVHTQLVEHAQRYFSAILAINEERKNELTPGTYTAKELADNMKAACGRYLLPDNEEFDGLLDITAETFHCSFRFRDIFGILAGWEAIAKPGKAKAVFEIEGAEEKTAPVLINEKTAMGTYKTKKIRLVRITGNWWRPRKLTKGMTNPAYYELNGVLFSTGKTFYAEDISERDFAKRWCGEFNDEYLVSVCRGYIRNLENSEEHRQYYTEVLTRAGIDLEEKKPEPTKETAEETATASAIEANKYRIFRYSHDEYAKIIVGDRKQGKAIAILLTIGNNNYIEINDESTGLSTEGQKQLLVSTPILELTDDAVLALIFNTLQPPTEPTQTRETTETENCTAKEVKRGIRTFDALAILEAFTRWRRGAHRSDIRMTADGSTLQPMAPPGILHAIQATAPPGVHRPPRAGPPLFNPYHTPIHSPP